MHFCHDEVRFIAMVVGGITLIPLYCRWCWYKVRAVMGRRQPLLLVRAVMGRRQPLLLPPPETKQPDQPQA